MECPPEERTPSAEACTRALVAVRDSLYVIGGKWKMPIIIPLVEAGGPMRFRELQRTLETITPKVLSKELKDLELNEFITRTVYDTTPVTVEYQLTDYSKSLGKVLYKLSQWGEQHRTRLKAATRARREKASAE